MLTLEGVWPNSLDRRPPWLHASSVKNKQTKQPALDLKPQILGPKIEEFSFLVHKLSIILTALHVNTNRSEK